MNHLIKRLFSDNWIASVEMFIKSTWPFLYFKESILTPALSPWVCSNPIFNSIFHTPTNYSDSMKCYWESTNISVYARLICEEIIMNLKICFERTISKNINLGVICFFKSSTILNFVCCHWSAIIAFRWTWKKIPLRAL